MDLPFSQKRKSAGKNVILAQRSGKPSFPGNAFNSKLVHQPHPTRFFALKPPFR